MCGIAGILGFNHARESPESALRAMGAALQHRGPDDHDEWIDSEAGIGLAHRRLAIVDLSSQGRQPMVSHCGRFCIVFNGEIYNHLDIRAELAKAGGRAWRGHSDTETLLEAIAEWGLRAALERSVGMFAFALWDRSTRVLNLARDRFGEKPLYYGWLGSDLLFASELKALCAHPGFRPRINRHAVSLFLRHNYVPAPHSIYDGVSKLPPGTVLTVPSIPGSASGSQPMPYWSAADAAQRGLHDRLSLPDSESIDLLEATLVKAIGQQMLADVPLGAFLSGGIDSSTVVALMQTQSSRPIKTFSIGFNEKEWDEAVHARAVAKHLGTEHTELYVAPEAAQAVIPQLPSIYDEPFADVSQIPTYLVAKLARQHVTVSLSGDAGDELFGGYNRYFWGRRIWRRLAPFPLPIRTSVSAGMRAISPRTWDRLYASGAWLVPTLRGQRAVGDKVHKLADIVAASSADDMYRRLVAQWQDPESVVIGADNTSEAEFDLGDVVTDITERMMLLDTLTYLPDDILAKVDRATMAVSLESRVPFLNHHVFELAWRMPLALKVRGGQGKWVLRQLLYRHVPAGLIERPKMGFGVPIGAWLRGPLREWAEGLLSAPRLRSEGFFRVDVVRAKWAEHLSGLRNWQYQLWGVLMFQSWLERRGVTPG